MVSGGDSELNEQSKWKEIHNHIHKTIKCMHANKYSY